MGRREQVLQEACAKLNQFASEALGGRQDIALGVQGDVRHYDSCAAAAAKIVERFGKIDVLVNNAAGNFMCDAESLTAKGFRTVIDIDLQGTPR